MKYISQMKRILLGLLLLIALPFIGNAQNLISTLGFDYEYSRTGVWAYGLPIVKRVHPYSLAEKLGLRTADIIEQIDEYPTYELSHEEFDKLIRSSQKEHILKVSNFAYKHRTICFKVEEKFDTSLSESELAQLFSAYSPVDVHRLLCPINIKVKHYNSPLNKYESFAIIGENEQSSQVDKAINDEIRAILKRLGLIEKRRSQAELLVSSYYELNILDDNKVSNKGELAYNFKSQTIEPSGFTFNPDVAAYQFKFGIDVQRGYNRSLVFNAEVEQLLRENQAINKLAECFLEPIFSLFPFHNKVGNELDIKHLKYLYTGISVDSEDITRITAVAEDSPAYHSGLVPNDRIIAVNGRKISPCSLSQAMEQMDFYQAKLGEAWENGKYAWWNIQYAPEEMQVASRDMLNNPNWESAFSYLFAFRPYIAPKSEVVIFKVMRKGVAYQVPIQAELRDETRFDFSTKD